MFRTTPLLIAVALALGPMSVLGVPAADLVPGADDPDTALIVGFAPGKMPEVGKGGQFGGHKVRDVSPEGRFVVVDAPGLKVAAALGKLPGVVYVESEEFASTAYTPNDPTYSNQWGLGKIGAAKAWDTTHGTTGATVAVLDTGVRLTHEDLKGSRLLPGYDYHRGDSKPEDECGHGTHVAGTVGATMNNGKGVAGVAQVNLMPVKVLGPTSYGGCTGSHTNIAKGIYFAVNNGADVIVMSLGGSSSSSTLKNAVDHAWSNGVLVVAAAGNNHGGAVMYPAAYSSAIAVTSVDSNLARSSFAAVGSELEIAAPGRGIMSTYYNNDASYASMSGTSMAAPHVGGVLALALSAAPSTTASTLRTKMASTAQDLGASGKDTSFGHGLVRADNLVAALAAPAPEPKPPVASFTYTTSDRTVQTDASGSSDPDGSISSYTWQWGDGSAATGKTATKTYANDGTYTVKLTVKDNSGLTHATSKSVTVSQPVVQPEPEPEPEPAPEPAPAPDSGPTYLTSGKQIDVPIAKGQEQHYRIEVPSGASKLDVELAGPYCSLSSCAVDADLYVKQGQQATHSAYDCRPYRTGNHESCSFSAPKAGTWYVRAYGYYGSGTVQLTATVTGGETVSNRAPTASFEWTKGSGYDILVDGTSSSDPDGDTLAYTWQWGDGKTSTGAKSQHTYATHGSYSVKLTVADGQGGAHSVTRTVTVDAPAPSDDGVSRLSDGTRQYVSIAKGGAEYYKVYVPAGQSKLDLTLGGPYCSLSSCSVDADLYVKYGAKPSLSDYECRPYKTGNNEKCSISSPQSGWWYVRIQGYKGSGTVHVTPDHY